MDDNMNNNINNESNNTNNNNNNSGCLFPIIGFGVPVILALIAAAAGWAPWTMIVNLFTPFIFGFGFFMCNSKKATYILLTVLIVLSVAFLAVGPSTYGYYHSSSHSSSWNSDGDWHKSDDGMYNYKKQGDGWVVQTY